MMQRARLNAAVAIVLAIAMPLASCGRPTRGGATDITGVMPRLEFSLIRASDGARVRAQDYRGKVVVLYLGYTHCPDECPTTLANLASALRRLGGEAKGVRVLFVTVDPARDTLPILKSYTAAFAPEIDGLRGSSDAITALARRYRVIYAVTPAASGHPYTVVHSDSVFFFDTTGRARLVRMSTADSSGVAEDIARLMEQAPS